MRESLWILEADGKINRFREILKKAGYTGTAFATGGHLLSGPKSLFPLLIDRNYHDARVPVRPERIEELKRLLVSVDHLFIATDPDDEGEVIAADVAGIALSINPVLPVTRIRLSSLNEKALAAAVSNGSPFRMEDSVPGTVRRVLDRWIGGTFSKGLPVGRVFSAFLAWSSSRIPVIGRVIVRYPAREGAAFSATIPLTPENREEWKKRLSEIPECPRASVGTVKEVPRASPFSFGDALLALRRDTGLSVSEGARRIQGLYERGILSYPRTDSRGLTFETAESLLPLARRLGLGDYDPRRVPAKLPDSPHEALHPCGDIFRIGDSVHRKIVDLITKRTLHSGLPPLLVEEPDPVSLPEWARPLGLSRPSKRFGSDRETLPQAGIYPDSPDAVVLMGIMEAGLGRPSTLPSHIMKLLEQKVLGEDFRPNGKGRAALALAPKEIADSRFTVRMEWTSRESKNQKSDVKETMGKILAVVSDDVRFRMEESLEEKLPSIESFSISSKKEENIGLGM
jgi:DNA topoisomerase-1